MTYMLLMIEPPEQRRERTRAEGEAVFARMLQFAEQLKSEGILRGVESLAAHSQAARVQAVRRGQGDDRRLLPGRRPDARGGHRGRTALSGRRMVHGGGALAGAVLRREQRLIPRFPGMAVETGGADSSCE
jgi:hypothetical protein